MGQPATSWLYDFLFNVKIILMLFLVAFSGCTTPKPQRGGSISAGPGLLEIVAPARPAQAEVAIPSNSSHFATPDDIGPRQGEGMPQATLAQPENPNAESGQAITYERTTEVSIPVEASTTTATTFPDGRTVTVTETLPAGTVKRESVKQGVVQNVSGSWKDTARELGAKLASYRPIQFFGAALILSAAAMFHPVFRAVVGGGKSTQMAVASVGVLMVFGPSLVVGNEKILIVAGLGFLAWHYLSSRLAYKEGIVDANNNGIPDDKEGKPMP